MVYAVWVCLREIIRAFNSGNLSRSAIRTLQTREASGRSGHLIYQLKPSGRTFIAEMVEVNLATSLNFTEFTHTSSKVITGPQLHSLCFSDTTGKKYSVGMIY